MKSTTIFEMLLPFGWWNHALQWKNGETRQTPTYNKNMVETLKTSRVSLLLFSLRDSLFESFWADEEEVITLRDQLT